MELLEYFRVHWFYGLMLFLIVQEIIKAIRSKD